MRIYKSDAIIQLYAENGKLDNQIALARNQEQVMAKASTTALGLYGNAYKAIEQRINMRAMALHAHTHTYEALKDANTKNCAMLTALPTSLTPGVLDTDECDSEIDWWISEINQLESELLSLTSLVVIDTDASVDTSASTSNYYATSIDHAWWCVDQWEKKKQAAYDYSSESSSLYDNVQNIIEVFLDPSSFTIENCILKGNYDSDALSRLLYLRLGDMREYLTDDEYAAIMAALGDDGIISADEIYSGSGTFNEALYSALAKLPDYLVTQDDIEAIATAYERMWTGENGPDTADIDRLLDLSYVMVPGATQDVRVLDDINPYKTKPFYLFDKSPLLSRLADEMSQRLPTCDTGKADYQELLAATNLLGVIQEDNHGFWAPESGIDAELFVAVDHDSQGGIDAIMSSLAINPLYEDRFTLLKPGATDGGDNAASNDFFCATGKMEAVSALMDNLVKKQVCPTIGPSDIYGTLIVDGVLTAASTIPGMGALSFIAGEVQTLGGMMKEMKKSETLDDPTYSNLTKEGRDGGGVLGLCDFAFNLGIGQDSAPSDYLGFQTKVYLSDANRATLDKLTGSYEDYQRREVLGLALDAPAKTGTYSTDTFISDLESNPVGTVAGDTGTSTTPVSKTASFDFISWCEAPAELEYKKDLEDPSTGIIDHLEGDPVNTKTITNYRFLTDPDSYPDFRFIWYK